MAANLAQKRYKKNMNITIKLVILTTADMWKSSLLVLRAIDIKEQLTRRHSGCVIFKFIYFLVRFMTNCDFLKVKSHILICVIHVTIQTGSKTSFVSPPFTTIHSFLKQGHHEVHRKGRDLGSLWKWSITLNVSVLNSTPPYPSKE